MSGYTHHTPGVYTVKEFLKFPLLCGDLIVGCN